MIKLDVMYTKRFRKLGSYEACSSSVLHNLEPGWWVQRGNNRSAPGEICAHRSIIKYQVLTSSVLPGILKVHRARDQLDVNGHRGQGFCVCAQGLWKRLLLNKHSQL